MTSRGLGLTDSVGQDIQEYDFSDLFLYNPPEEDFPDGCDKGMCVCLQHLFCFGK